MCNSSTKYKSCNLIQHGLCFFDDALVSCCYSPVDQINSQKPPTLYPNYKGEILSKEELFSRIDKYTSIFKNGGIPFPCKGCYKIEEKEWDEEDIQYINYVTVSNYNKCNADCIYCSNNCSPKQRSNSAYKILPVLRSLKEQNILRQNFELHIGGGEFTIYEESEDILKEFALTNFAKVYIATNAIKYSDLIYEGINNGNTWIVISLDCGCRKTFKKIKRVDAFDKVIENIKKYATASNAKLNIAIKYIIIPTINDNEKEFRKFVNIVKECGLTNILIDIDARYLRRRKVNYDNFFISLANSFYEIAKKEKMYVDLYSFISQCIHSNKKEYKSVLENKITRIKLHFDKDIKRLYKEHNY